MISSTASRHLAASLLLVLAALAGSCAGCAEDELPTPGVGSGGGAGGGGDTATAPGGSGGGGGEPSCTPPAWQGRGQTAVPYRAQLLSSAALDQGQLVEVGFTLPQRKLAPAGSETATGAIDLATLRIIDDQGADVLRPVMVNRCQDPELDSGAGWSFDNQNVDFLPCEPFGGATETCMVLQPSSKPQAIGNAIAVATDTEYLVRITAGAPASAGQTLKVMVRWLDSSKGLMKGVNLPKVELAAGTWTHFEARIFPWMDGLADSDSFEGSLVPRICHHVGGDNSGDKKRCRSDADCAPPKTCAHPSFVELAIVAKQPSKALWVADARFYQLHEHLYEVLQATPSGTPLEAFFDVIGEESWPAATLIDQPNQASATLSFEQVEQVWDGCADDALPAFMVYQRSVWSRIFPWTSPVTTEPDQLAPLRLLRGEQTLLPFAVYAPEALSKVVASLSSISDGLNTLIGQDAIDCRIVHVWKQSGWGKLARRDKSYIAVPELLVKAEPEGFDFTDPYPAAHGPDPDNLCTKDKLDVFDSGSWGDGDCRSASAPVGYYIPPSMPFESDTASHQAGPTALAASSSKAFLCRIATEANVAPGDYHATLTIEGEHATRGWVSRSVELQVAVSPVLLTAAAPLALANNPYSHGLTTKKYLPEQLYGQYLQDMRAHGMTTLMSTMEDIMAGLPCSDPATAKTICLDYQAAAQHGFSQVQNGVLKKVPGGEVCPGPQSCLAAPLTDYCSFATQFAQSDGVDTFFFGLDEPNGPPEGNALAALSDLVHDPSCGGKIMVTFAAHDDGAIAAFSDAWAQAHPNPQPTEAPLDLILYNPRFGDAFFFGPQLPLLGPDGRAGIYLQSYQEDPTLALLYAGFYLAKAKLSAFAAYAYSRATRSPYRYDQREGGGSHWQQRPALSVYPSQQGPIPTLGWEAIREGLLDYRIATTLRALCEKTSNADELFDELLEPFVGPGLGEALETGQPYVPVETFAQKRRELLERIEQQDCNK